MFTYLPYINLSSLFLLATSVSYSARTCPCQLYQDNTNDLILSLPFLMSIFPFQLTTSVLVFLPRRALAKMSWVGSLAEEDRCDTLAGLVKRQRRLCRRNVELMDSVKTGALMAIEECQAQFQNRRWNCSTTDSNRLFGRVILKQGKVLYKLLYRYGWG